MKFAPLFLLLSTLALASCRRPVPTSVKTDPFPEHPPVIDAQPVDTKSYEAGFSAGLPAGKAAANPRAKVPDETAVRQLAIEAAGDDPAHNLKWRDGWTRGYLEGFRAHALNTK